MHGSGIPVFAENTNNEADSVEVIPGAGDGLDDDDYDNDAEEKGYPTTRNGYVNQGEGPKDVLPSAEQLQEFRTVHWLRGECRVGK
jgi:hypothetical protein